MPNHYIIINAGNSYNYSCYACAKYRSCAGIFGVALFAGTSLSNDNAETG